MGNVCYNSSIEPSCTDKPSCIDKRSCDKPSFHDFRNPLTSKEITLLKFSWKIVKDEWKEIFSKSYNRYVVNKHSGSKVVPKQPCSRSLEFISDPFETERSPGPCLTYL